MRKNPGQRGEVGARTCADVVVAGLDEVLPLAGLGRLGRLLGHGGEAEAAQRQPLEEAGIDIRAGGRLAHEAGRARQPTQGLLVADRVLRRDYQVQQRVLARLRSRHARHRDRGGLDRRG